MTPPSDSLAEPEFERPDAEFEKRTFKVPLIMKDT